VRHSCERRLSGIWISNRSAADNVLHWFARTFLAAKLAVSSTRLARVGAVLAFPIHSKKCFASQIVGPKLSPAHIPPIIAIIVSVRP